MASMATFPPEPRPYECSFGPTGLKGLCPFMICEGKCPSLPRGGFVSRLQIRKIYPFILKKKKKDKEKPSVFRSDISRNARNKTPRRASRTESGPRSFLLLSNNRIPFARSRLLGVSAWDVCLQRLGTLPSRSPVLTRGGADDSPPCDPLSPKGSDTHTRARAQHRAYGAGPRSP